MPHSKRKKKPQQRKKLYNVKAAAEKFTLRLKELCERANNPLYELLSLKDKINIRYYCFIPNNVHQHPISDHIDGKILSHIDGSLRKLNDTLRVRGITEDISVLDGLILDSVQLVTERFKTDTGSQSFRTAAEQLKNYYQADLDKVNLQLGLNAIFVVSTFGSAIKKHYNVQITPYKNPNKNSSTAGLGYSIMISLSIPKPEYEIINNRSRPIFPVTLISPDGPRSVVEIDSSEITKLYHGTQKKLPIYMQSHAYERLLQRELPMNKGQVNMCLLLTIITGLNTQIFRNNLLIDYKGILGKKHGYFLACIKNDRIIIKTYLPITHNSTPEGAKFRELTGMNKFDLNYWDIDKLSTFVDNEMTEDNELYPYFKDSGLLHLFNLQPDTCMAHGDEIHTMQWDSINTYMKKGDYNTTLSNTELKDIDTEHFFSR